MNPSERVFIIKNDHRDNNVIPKTKTKNAALKNRVKRKFD
ncbi:hypothetical protein PROVALCAL_00443 [Providencia alcalifaciens DSM 30120]|uniref:Uncharacterized protein n=1 Tax=Providencia alcalifaciens DSM 30120 TaxID=520999 RepID=B6XAU0_9GAMM|nr:hypothetical protein PROVALCAL_00443 [Providencia alcalifaciens DSM 30120]